MFRVITRRLVEQRNNRAALEARLADIPGLTAGVDERGSFYGGDGVYAEGAGNANGSFRVGAGDKRRSWLGLPQFLGDVGEERENREGTVERARRRKGCC